MSRCTSINTLDVPLEARQLLSGTYSLVKDVLPGSTTAGSLPENFTQAGNTTFFTAYSEATGVELWKTDGTQQGTKLVREIIPGADDSTSRGGDLRDLTNVDGTLFFVADDGLTGSELWKSDGTSAGTMLVKNIQPDGGYGGGDPFLPRALHNHNGTLFFAADDGVHGTELWKSDGSESGTVMVKDIADGDYFGQPLSSLPETFATIGGSLFFTASGDNYGRELWKTDGTAGGTVVVKDIMAYGLTSVEGKLFFTSRTGNTGIELWVSDGTESGTTLLKDIEPGADGSYPSQLTDVSGTLYFTANNSASGTELWKTDGTTAGTTIVHEVAQSSGSSEPQYLTNVNGIVYFSANDGVFGRELFRTDGTSAGTYRVRNINTGGPTASADPGNLVNVGGTLYFRAEENATGRELWKSDGTESGTVLVKDVFAGLNNSGYPNSSWPTYLHNANGTLVFRADDGTHGDELWASDGTSGGTQLIADIANSGSDPSELVNRSGQLIFTTRSEYLPPWEDQDANPPLEELHASDGTASGTTLLHNFGGMGTRLQELTRVGDDVFFAVNDGTHGSELWKTDGTAAGTELVKDLWPSQGSSNPHNLTAVGNTLFFAADSGDGNGIELWKSDGTAAGTVLVRDLQLGAASTFPQQLTNVSGTLYFTAKTTAEGFELWKSDGTYGGTTLVRDIVPGGAPYLTDQAPGEFYNHNGTLYFAAYDANVDRELWKSDGTEAGTVRVKDIYTGSFSSGSPFGFKSFNNDVYFFAGSPDGLGLWKSDGTDAGTVSVKLDTQFLTLPNFEMGTAGSLLFFSFRDGANGQELWRTDGTAGGTIVLKDLNPGPGSSNPRHFREIDGLLYFNANDGVNGERLWVSDGTSAGTVPVDQAAGQALAIDPSAVVQAGSTTFFSAISPDIGRELFIVDEEITAPPSSAPTITSPGSTTLQLRPTISWDVVENATEYEIWVKNQSTGENPFHQATVSSTSYTPDVDFEIGRFNLWIRAKNSLGNGPWTSQYNFTIDARASVTDPGRFLSTHRPTLTWPELPGAVKYDLWIDDKLGGVSQFVRDQNVTGTSWTPASDIPLGLYHAWIRGIAADGTSGGWSVTTIFYVMPSPTMTAGNNPTFDRTPTFAWDALPGAVKYELFIRNRNAGSTELYQQNITDLNFTVPSALADGPYRVWMLGVSDDNVRSFWTDPMDIFVGGRTDVLTPMGSNGDTTPEFTWRPVDGAVRYDLWVDQVGGQSQIIREQNLTTTSYTPGAALPAGNYRVWVRAISSTSETSDWSLQVDFTIAATFIPEDGLPVVHPPLTVPTASRPGSPLLTSGGEGTGEGARPRVAPTHSQPENNGTPEPPQQKAIANVNNVEHGRLMSFWSQHTEIATLLDRRGCEKSTG